MKKPDYKKAKLIDFRYFLFDIGKFFAILPGLIWLRPKWIFENDKAKKKIHGPAILMFNHAGFTDPILAQFAVWYRRQHFVATKELFRGKFMNRLFNVFHCIEIDRANFNFNTFREITDHLGNGRVVSIFPEGHINFDEGSVTAFKSGVVMMALRSGSPVVPVYMKAPKSWKECAVFVIGEPIFLKEQYGALPSVDTINKISEDLRIREIELSELIK